MGTLDLGADGVATPGDVITYTLTVENTGNTTLTDVTITDPGLDSISALSDNGGDGETVLAPGAVETATGTYAISQADIDAGVYDNLATVSGEGPGGDPNDPNDDVTDDDPHSEPIPQNAQIDIDKVTGDGLLNPDGSFVNPGNNGDGLFIAPNNPITWTYTITNTGDVTLSDIQVNDDQIGPITNIVNQGDGDAFLSPNESWIYQADGTSGEVPYLNEGTVTGDYNNGQVMADDTSSYFPSQNTFPDGSIIKVTGDGILNPDGTLPIDFFDTNFDGPTILAGEDVVWTYIITNSTSDPVFEVSVTDNQPGVTPEYVSGDDSDLGVLNPGETWIYQASGTAIASDYNNIGVVMGEFEDDLGNRYESTDDDPSNYLSANPAIAIDKVTTNGTVTGDNITVTAGDAITWIYTVTNAGDVPLSNVSVDDNQLPNAEDPVYISGDTNIDGILDLTESWRFEATGIAIEGDYSNLGIATGSFTDSLGNTRIVMADDPSSYFGECPPCEFDIFESFSGPNINVTIILEEYVNEQGEDAGVKFTVTETDPDLIGDLRGVFFHVDPDTTDVLTGLTVNGDDVTEFRVGEDSINDLGNGANMTGDGGYRYEDSDGDIIKGHKYDVGVEIGTQGIGTDDIQSTMFIVSNPDVELDVENFADVEFGVRLTSVGAEGGSRGQSSKVFGLSPEDCGCELPPAAGFAETEQPVFG